MEIYFENEQDREENQLYDLTNEQHNLCQYRFKCTIYARSREKCPTEEKLCRFSSALEESLE